MATLGDDDELGDNDWQPDHHEEEGCARIDFIAAERVGQDGELDRDQRSNAGRILGSADPADWAKEESEEIARRNLPHRASIAQELVDRRLGAGLLVDALDDDGAIERWPRLVVRKSLSRQC